MKQGAVLLLVSEVLHRYWPMVLDGMALTRVGILQTAGIWMRCDWTLLSLHILPTPTKPIFVCNALRCHPPLGISSTT